MDQGICKDLSNVLSTRARGQLGGKMFTSTRLAIYLPWVDGVLSSTKIGPNIETMLHTANDVREGSTAMSKAHLQLWISFQDPTKHKGTDSSGRLSWHSYKTKSNNSHTTFTSVQL